MEIIVKITLPTVPPLSNLKDSAKALTAVIRQQIPSVKWFTLKTENSFSSLQVWTFRILKTNVSGGTNPSGKYKLNVTWAVFRWREFLSNKDLGTSTNKSFFPWIPLIESHLIVGLKKLEVNSFCWSYSDFLLNE